MCFLCAGAAWQPETLPGTVPAPLAPAPSSSLGGVGRTAKEFLVLFTYAGASSAAAENLLFFLLFGFDPASAAVDYVVLIVDGQDGPPPLPKDVDARLTAGVAAGMGGGP